MKIKSRRWRLAAAEKALAGTGATAVSPAVAGLTQ
jgi:hypothetical protein